MRLSPPRLSRAAALLLGLCYMLPAHALAAAVAASGFAELPVTALHAAGVARLDAHHGDPFDRLLVAQALAEPLRLVTADEALARYSDLVVHVGDIGRPA